MDIGTRLRSARKAKSLSQERLARQADVSLNVVSRLERGEIEDPHISTLIGLSQALGIPVEELLEEPVTAGKAEAPAETGLPEEAAEQHYHLRALFGTCAALAENLYARFADLVNRLKRLPESPTPEEWRRGRLEIDYFLTEFDALQEVLAGQRVGELMQAHLATANDAGDDEIGRALDSFFGAQGAVFGELIPEAVRWVRRTAEADRGALEMERWLTERQRKSQASGLLRPAWRRGRDRQHNKAVRERRQQPPHGYTIGSGPHDAVGGEEGGR